jgi:hypothetical protein
VTIWKAIGGSTPVVKPFSGTLKVYDHYVEVNLG